MKHWKLKLSSCFLLLAITCPVFAETMLLEPNIQGYYSGDIVHALISNGKYYLDIQDMSESLKFKFTPDSGEGTFMGKSFSVQSMKSLDTDFMIEGGREYYSMDFYEKLFPIKLSINPLEMQLDIKSDQILPTTRQKQNSDLRNNMGAPMRLDPFSNYEFDNRYFTFPVMDFIYRRNENLTNWNRAGESRSFGDYYQANFGMLFAGLDTQVTVFSDDYGSNKLTQPRARITAAKTLLEEPRNKANLVKFQIGDILGMNNTLFHYGTNGRGLVASSFKDLVISADKTIDITGVLPNGWEAELYLNNQLIGFRQGSIDGRYEFKNIPVNYGLNDFKVILYGPFGETREEERRYYSGTSPVKSGELGYNINVYQADRYLFESNEPSISDTNSLVGDSMVYYGVTDHLTMSGGFVNVESASQTGENLQFGTAGLQLALNGLSLQYNTNYSFNNNAVGHHFDVQGDIYIGGIFARYEYYGNIESPISYYQNNYLKDLFETRLTGLVPFVNVPYYLSYIYRSNHENDLYQEVHARISPNFRRYYNFTLENVWRQEIDYTENYLDAMLQASYRNLRLHAKAKYQTLPDNYLRDYGASLEYRWDKNTFFQANWLHDCRSKYMDVGDLDSFSIGLGRLFPFGGINISAGFDTDKNLSFGLTYNISLGKIPYRPEPFINAETQMSNYGSIYARAVDNYGAPVSDVKLIVGGRENPSVTDDKGEVLITNLEPYQKTLIIVDETDVDDLALVPEFTSKKLVLRPGVLRPVDIPFNKRGGFDGQLTDMNTGEGYNVYIKNQSDETIAVKSVDSDGSFIFDGIKFGRYNLEVRNNKDQLLNKMDIVIGTSFYSITTPISVSLN